MKLKSCIKFQVSEFTSATIKYYLILLILYCFSTIISLTITTSGSLSGIETISTIFIFILMIASFKDHFNMLQQNGISRKAFFWSTVIAGTAFAFILILLDTVLYDVFSLVLNRDSNKYMTNFYEQVYPSRYENASFIQKTGEIFLFIGCINMAAASAALTISAIYYRLSKVLKIVVFTGIPAAFILFVPTDSIIFNGFFTDVLNHLITVSFGVGTNNPYIPMLTLLILSAITFFIGWIAIRRTPVKEK